MVVVVVAMTMVAAGQSTYGTYHARGIHQQHVRALAFNNGNRLVHVCNGVE